VLLAYTYFFAISVKQKIIITRLFFQNIKLNDCSYLESAMNKTDGQVDDPVGIWFNRSGFKIYLQIDKADETINTTTTATT